MFAVLSATLLACSAASGPSPGDTVEARVDRDRLVARLAERRAARSSVLDAMRKVPRHLFVDASTREAYEDRILRIGLGQTISQPHVVAVMTDALELDGHQHVLEIGTGSGYQAAVLSLLSDHVDSIEIIPTLADAARERLRALGYRNVDVRTGDGYAGWPERAPFDRILLTAAPPTIPRALYDQLAEGGLLVAPVGEARGSQRLVRWRKEASGPVKEDLGAVVFVPMVPR
jgi:protein-L-isoaspartate(D-aspartate) O-methyltransferase